MSDTLRRFLPLLIGGGARLAAACIGLAGTTIAARALGPEGWGHWVVLLAAFGWSQHGAEWGLRNVALVEGGRAGRVSIGFVQDLCRARAPVLALAGLGLVGGAQLWRQDLLVPALWLAFALVAIAANLDWAALVRGSPGLAGATLILRPALFLLVVLLLPPPLDLAGLACATFIGWAGAAALGASEWRRLAPDPPGRPRLAPLGLLRAGTPFFLLATASQLALSGLLVAIAWLLGAKAAGTFGLVLTIAQTATLGGQASAQWWLAQSRQIGARQIGARQVGARQPGDGPLGTVRLRRIAGEAGLVGALVAAALATLGPGLVSHLFGQAWQEAAALLPAAGLYVALAHVTAVLAAVAHGRGRAGSVAALHLAVQALALPLQLLLAVSLGLESVVWLRGLLELAWLVLLGNLCRRPMGSPLISSKGQSISPVMSPD